MKVPYFIPWITNQDKSTVTNALSQRWLSNGKFLKLFEQKFRDYLQIKYAIGVSSATHALHLSVKSLGIKPGDEVIVPTFTFAASANAVIYCGAKPILVDVDSDTFNILTTEIEKNITKKTKAIIAVHYGGQACDMNKIISLAKKHSLQIIEDCAHSLGSMYKSKFCGSIGSTGCFSFYPTKIITTGEGGMVVTNNKKIASKISLLKSQGMNISALDRESSRKWKYDVIDVGYNYRLDEIRASLGFSQLKRINQINKMRIKIAEKYDEKLKKIKGIIIPYKKNDRNHIYHLYTIKIEKDYSLTRDELFDKMSSKGIGTTVQYYPLHLMSYMKNYSGKSKSQFLNSSILKDKVLCLPIFPTMTDKQLEFVVKTIKSYS